MTGDVTLIIVSATITISIIIIILSIMLRFRYHREISLGYLGVGSLVISIGNIASPHLLFYMMLLMPLPFMLYMNSIQSGRYRKFYSGACCVLVAGCVLLSILDAVKVLPYSEYFLYIFLYSMAFIILGFITLINDIHRGLVKDYLVSAVIMVCLWLILFSRIMLYVFRGAVTYSAVFPVGMILLQILAVIHALHEIGDMESQRQQAIFANEAKGKFLANMSHEIRTPINAVLGMDTMILRESTEPKIKEYALDIQNAGQSLLSLINDILDLSKIESGKLELLPQEYDFGRLIHDTINMITVKADGKGLAVNAEIDDSLPSTLYGDNTRLRQILINIMNNAVKYTESGSVTLSVSGVKRDAAPSAAPNVSGKDTSERHAVLDLTFHVKDTGIGIREEDIPKLFAEFERIEEQRNRNIEGTGLGMSITTQLLGMMGSKLEVDSVYGEGSDFFFTVSQTIVDDAPVGNLAEQIKKQAEEYSYSETFTAPEAAVLVTDDNAMNRKVFTSLLKSTGVQIDEAAGGMECIKMTQEKYYDIIFLDHMMPDIDGIETLHRIVADDDNPCRTVPVIALTANAIAGAKEMYLSEGFDDFLSKPIDPEKLEKMLVDKLPEEKIQRTEAAPVPENSGQNPADLEELPEVEGIDWKYASLRLKSQDLLMETVKDFYKMAGSEAEQLASFSEQISAATANGDGELLAGALDQYRIKVHSMKSTSAMIGAVWLSGTARLLEYAARDGNTQVIGAVTPVFLGDWKDMTEALKPLCAVESSAHIQIDSENVQTVKDYLYSLDKAMEAVDIDTADEVIEKLKQYIYPEPLSGLIDKLDIAVANIDSTQVTEIIKEFLEKFSIEK